MKTVKLPKWFDKEQSLATTDAVDTYCCSLEPCWFVEVIGEDYSGYFEVKDLEIVK